MQELIGKKVTVHVNVGNSDSQHIGIIEAFEENILKLRKGESEYLYFSIFNISMIKLF